MKRVVNCILRDDNRILMLQKPKRGWWVVPGGKIEPTETINEAIKREFYEETNLTLEAPQLKGVFNIIIKDGVNIVEEWMMFTYLAKQYSGIITTNCKEGILRWRDIREVLALPKAKGNNVYLEHILKTEKFISGKFYYTTDYELLSYSLDNNVEIVNVY